MSESSAIEWTDATWNPVRGCTQVSPGCANCYAETFAERFRGVSGHPYEQGFDLRLVPEKLDEPTRWKKGKRIFVNSMSDLFQDGVPNAFIDQAFAVMARTPQHTYQLLTKRAERMQAYSATLAAIDPKARARRILGAMYEQHPARNLVLANIDDAHLGGFTWPLPNVWFGVSVENQHFADERIPLLLLTPAAVRFISAEPLLERVNLRDLRPGRGVREQQPLQPVLGWPIYDALCGVMETRANGGGGLGYDCARLDWVIVGGESGAGARSFHIDWARTIVSACRSARVPVFVKQLGARVIDRNDAGFMGEWPEAWPDHIDIEDRVEHDLDGTRDGYQGAPVRVHLRSRKGGDPLEWPEDLRVREFPAVRA